MKTMKIALDAAGGDYAPHEVVKGAIKAVQEYGVEIILVGRQNVIRKLSEKALVQHRHHDRRCHAR